MKSLLSKLILVSVSIMSYGQNRKIDSLINKFESLNSDTKKLNLLEELNPMIFDTTLSNSTYYFKEMVKIAKKNQNIELEAMGYRCLSEHYLREGDSLNAKKYGLKTIIDLDKRTYLLGINQLGRVYDHFREYDKAIEIYKKGIDLELKEEEDTIKVKGNIYSNLGIVYGSVKDFSNQIKMYLYAKDFAIKINDLNGLSTANRALGWSYMDLTQYDTAEKFFIKSLKDSSKIKQRYIYETSHALGVLYSRVGKFEKSIYHNKRALYYFKKVGNKFYELDVLINLSILYQRSGNNSLAIDYAKKTLKLAESLDHKFLENIAKETLIHNYIKQENFFEAKKLLLEIAPDTINNALVNLNSKTNINEYLSIVYEKENDYSKSLRYFKKFKNNNDSLQSEKINSKLEDIETKYQSEKKEKENLQLIADNVEQELLTQKANTQKWVFFLFSIISILSLILYIKYMQSKKKQLLYNSRLNVIKAKQNEQEEIGIELHDNVAKKLESISIALNKDGKTELANQTITIKNKIRKLSKELSTISFEESSFKDQIITLSSGYQNESLKIHIKGLDAILWSTIDSPIKYNLFLIIREAISNSYNHSDATSILLKIKQEKKNMSISIQDNGKGFDENMVTYNRGFRNMKIRVNDINGIIKIKSQINKGTQIFIQLALA
ncbi:tetratricopeptide repeat-containing sensor histidine kinase [Psychroserpens luteus]|uniref:Tetratricopeptide repeat protein n=1 Tax=Psychroserpens luteus TaxID=1434066 RepID=A0ABW5ZXP8_9FLAO|nr:tetratricopeptide repeat protein [Psychroserpens luteus]